jgi:hypothetical protein
VSIVCSAALSLGVSAPSDDALGQLLGSVGGARCRDSSRS